MPGISYFGGKLWSEITREERVFCAALFGRAAVDPALFARWLTAQSALCLEASDYWEIGYEVCFYRDMLFQRGASVRPSSFSPKRTFDLCLFSDRVIIIVEAKVFQCFEAKQGAHFSRDREQIKALLGQDVDVRLVALGSSRRLNQRVWDVRPAALQPFDGYITWLQVNELFPDPLFARADSICAEGVRI